MRHIGIGFVCLVLVLSKASVSLKIGDYFTQNDSDVEPIQFQNDLKNLFDAIYDNDTERTETIFKYFESIGPNDLNNLTDSNEIEYFSDRILYVVSLVQFSIDELEWCVFFAI